MASYPNLEATGQEYILEEQYKTLFGYPNGLVNGSLDLEVPGTSRPFILQNQIYSQDIPIQAPTDLGDTATTQIPPDTGVYVSYRKSINYPYLTKYYNVKLSYTNTYKPGVGALTWWFEADKTDGQRQVKYNILNKGVPNNLDPSNSYLPELKRNTVPLTLGNAQFPWTYNVNSGIVLFTGSSEYVTGDQKNNTPSKDDDIRMTFWRYEGATGTPTATTYWEATTTPINGIQYGALSVETDSNNSGSIYTQNILAKDAAANVNLYTNLITDGSLTIGSAISTSTFNSALVVGGTATFNNYAPVCGVTATNNNNLVNKGYVDSSFVSSKSTVPIVQFGKVTSDTSNILLKYIMEQYLLLFRLLLAVYLILQRTHFQHKLLSWESLVPQHLTHIMLDHFLFIMEQRIFILVLMDLGLLIILDFKALFFQTRFKQIFNQQTEILVILLDILLFIILVQ
jgi:hypothetical protein